MTAVDLANRAPLVTVCRTEYLDGSLPVTRDGVGTREAETRAGLPRARYFYASRACEDFGDLALVFDPSIESHHTGSASPFDTGGAVAKKPHHHPLQSTPHGGPAAVALIVDTATPLPSWRARFADFLAHYFPTTMDYFRDVDPTWGPHPPPWDRLDLPANDGRNTGHWRSWTWEVRLHEPHPVAEGLIAWATENPTVLDRISQRVEDGQLPETILAALTSASGIPPVGIATGTGWCAPLKSWIMGHLR